MTHMDIVPPGELSLWRGDPYKAWIEKGRIYGRGAEDNQQDMVASLFAIKAFREEKQIPPYDIGVALVADEETGSRKGIDYVRPFAFSQRHCSSFLSRLSSPALFSPGVSCRQQIFGIANQILAYDRGRLAEGQAADLVSRDEVGHGPKAAPQAGAVLD
jgi:hypothetical protein